MRRLNKANAKGLPRNTLGKACIEGGGFQETKGRPSVPGGLKLAGLKKWATSGWKISSEAAGSPNDAGREGSVARFDLRRTCQRDFSTEEVGNGGGYGSGKLRKQKGG